MKKLLIAVALTVLSGCSTISTLLMAHFDSTEYQYVTHIRTVAQRKKCDVDTVKEMYNTTLELKNYSQYVPHNESQIKLNDDLFKLVEELYKKENPSVMYCSAKLNIIESASERIQQVTGSKPR